MEVVGVVVNDCDDDDDDDYYFGGGQVVLWFPEPEEMNDSIGTLVIDRLGVCLSVCVSLN